MDREFNIELTEVLLPLPHRDGAVYMLALFQMEDGVVEVEDSLLPVRGRRERPRAEAHVLLHLSELNVEPQSERMHVILAHHGKREFVREVELLLRDCREIGFPHFDHVRADLVHVDPVDERLGERAPLHSLHVYVVDGVPEGVFIFLVDFVFDADHVDGGFTGEEDAALTQPFVARVEHAVEHRLVEQHVAHPLRDYDIHFVHAVG